jgi:hypothetical protein
MNELGLQSGQITLLLQAIHRSTARRAVLLVGF